MKAVVALLLGVAAAYTKVEYTKEQFESMNHVETFEEWAKEFGKTYVDYEEAGIHYMTWLDNLWTIADTNSQDLTYKLALNQFSDLTGDEFKVYVHGKDGACFKGDDRDYVINVGGQDVFDDLIRDEQPAGILADSVDWTTKGVVTPVKNQGQCGSCWAFSATGAMECDYAIKTGTLNSLSEQMLVDCAGRTYGCAGCNGGQMYGAMEYAHDEGGLCLESAYKYTARDGTCKATSCGTKYDNPTGGKGYTPVTKDSETAFVTATNAGCISIGIEADQTAFQHYSSGVLTGSCGTNIDHGVLIVGYGTSGTQDYWKVKNSWGVTWGEKGYVLICRNCNKNGGKGECGILTEGNLPNF